MKKRYWVLEVAYDGSIDVAKDKRLEGIVGKRRSGSGCGFGQRDMDWTFDTQTKANTAAKAVRAAGFIDITVMEYERD